MVVAIIPLFRLYHLQTLIAKEIEIGGLKMKHGKHDYKQPPIPPKKDIGGDRKAELTGKDISPSGWTAFGKGGNPRAGRPDLTPAPKDPRRKMPKGTKVTHAHNK